MFLSNNTNNILCSCYSEIYNRLLSLKFRISQNVFRSVRLILNYIVPKRNVDYLNSRITN